MSHFTRTHTDAVWTAGGAGSYVTLQSDWQDLADKGFKSLNGDKGGTWAPTTPIVINTGGMVVTGPAEVNYGGKLATSAGARFQLGNDEWPKLGPNHVGRTRVLRSPVHTRIAGSRYHFADCPAYVGSLQTIALTVAGAAGLEQPTCHIPLRVHDGARLASGVVKIRVPAPRAKAPIAMPRLRVIRVDRDGTIESLRAPSATVDAAGYSSFPRVTSGDAWYAGGAAQSWAFTCDQNHTIDTSLYVYYVQLIEEVGTSDPTIVPTAADGTLVRARKADVVFVFENAIPYVGDPNPVGPPGVPTIVTGDRCLIVAGAAGSTATQNGVWLANCAPGGEWTRAPDCDQPSDFTPGVLVFDTYQGAVWECVTPVYGQSIKLTAATGQFPGATEIQFRKRVPRGNVYHSIVCTFDQISDMRPQ